MRLRPLACVALLLPIFATAVANAQNSTRNEPDQNKEWAQLVHRYNEPSSVNLMSSGTWTLIHAAESKAEVKGLLDLLTHLSDPIPTQDQSFVNELGGARGFKEKLAVFLTSKDDVVAGFAATMLGIAGDIAYAPAIAKLLDKTDPPDESERSSEIISRGRAAVALSLLGAKEYVPKLVAMLQSSNMYDRSGAALALGQLHATEHAKEVAAILSRKELRFDHDASPIYALVEMGVATEHAGEIAKVLQDEFAGEKATAAGYALAKIGAKQYAKDVAKLLGEEYRKGEAAKALAIMGANEYEDEIAKMLSDKSSLNRDDALLALGVLNSTKYVSNVAVHLKDPEGFVKHFAATSLVLLGAEQYADEIIPLVENAYQQDLYLTADEFDPLVEEQLVGIRLRFKESYLRMKARRTKVAAAK
jgi:HEAT repeat protein